MALPTRTRIPLAGANTKMAPHNFYDFHSAYPTAGNIFFVHNSGSSTATATSPEDAISTIDGAINLCTASQGDVIFVLPGHSETITTAGAIAQDVAGVSIIGLGEGALRPLVNFGGTAATWAISAASCLVKNINVKATVDEVAKMFNVTAADVTLDGVNYIDNTTVQAIQFVLTTAAADNLTVKNCVHYKSAAAAATEVWVSLISCDRPRILDNTFVLKLRDNAAACVIGGDASVVMAELGRNRIHMTGYSAALLSAVLMASGATGIHYDGRIYADVAAVTTINDFPTGASFEVYCSNDLDKNGILDPVVGS